MRANPPRHDAGGRLRPAWPAESTVRATFSDCGRYRYQLREVWDPSGPVVLWLMMNPSVACLEYSDPTLRRTGNFTRRWGYGGQLVGNVHAYRTTNKNRLLDVSDPVGPENDRMIMEMASEARIVILAYGQPPSSLRRRGDHVVNLLRGHPHLCHLRLARDGTPVHPLYLPANLEPQPWLKAASDSTPSSGRTAARPPRAARDHSRDDRRGESQECLSSAPIGCHES